MSDPKKCDCYDTITVHEYDVSQPYLSADVGKVSYCGRCNMLKYTRISGCPCCSPMPENNFVHLEEYVGVDNVKEFCLKRYEMINQIKSAKNGYEKRSFRDSYDEFMKTTFEVEYDLMNPNFTFNFSFDLVPGYHYVSEMNSNDDWDDDWDDWEFEENDDDDEIDIVVYDPIKKKREMMDAGCSSG